MLADNFVRQLRFDLALPNELIPDEEHCYLVPIDTDIAVSIKSLEPHLGLQFKTLVGKCPERPSQEELFVTLMLANLFGQGTNNSVLLLDNSGTHVILSLTVPHDTTYVEFKEDLEDFLNYAEYWQYKLMQAAALATSKPSP